MDYSSFLAKFLGMRVSSDTLDMIVFGLKAMPILALIGAIVMYVLFLNRRNETKFRGFVKWLYNFFNFRILFLEAVLKVTYIASVILIIFFSFFAIVSGEFQGGLITLIVGIIVSRILFETMLLSIMLLKNTSDIRNKLIDPEGYDSGKALNAFDSFENTTSKMVGNISNNSNYNMNNGQMNNGQMNNGQMNNDEGVFCHICGTKASSGAEFCPNCGTKIK